MSHDLLFDAVLVLALGFAAQWLAWRTRLPSILPLMGAGFLAGPLFGWLDPEALLGDLLLPFVSAAVALILFEGGLSLRFREIRQTGRATVRLVTLGVLFTGLSTTAAAWAIAGLSLPMAALIGAILVVTGPTVILPMLQLIRPIGDVGPILKWEGNFNDAIGAVLAILVFETILAEGAAEGALLAATGFLQAVLAGVGIGLVAGTALIVVLSRDWLPGYLHSMGTLSFVVVAYVAADAVQPESGLLAATVMGIMLANQRQVSVGHIVEFKENLGILLLTVLFVLLSARIDLDLISRLGWEHWTFVAALVLVIRPAAVALCTIGSSLRLRDRIFLGAMAPRGVVAFAVASLFSLDLATKNYPDADRLLPLAVAAVVGTVFVYGVLGMPLARLLGLAQSEREGIVVVGAHRWARLLAKAVDRAGGRVLMVDNNTTNIHAARYEGLPAQLGDVRSRQILDELDLGRVGRLLALTANDQVNRDAAARFRDVFGPDDLYVLPTKGQAVRGRPVGRTAFGAEHTYNDIVGRLDRGARVCVVPITEGDDESARKAVAARQVIPLIQIRQGRIVICADAAPCIPRPGDTLVALAHPETELPVEPMREAEAPL